MTPEELRHCASILLAAADGKSIQEFSDRGNNEKHNLHKWR